MRVLSTIGLVVLLAANAPRLPAQESGIRVGSRAPAVEVNDLEGNPVDLGRYIKRQPLFLEFWATWCELCEQLLTRIRTALSAYGDKEEFIGINVTVNQSPARVKKYLEKHQPGFRTLYDDQGTSIRAYQVPATSYVVIVDRGGKVAYTGIGGEQNFDDVLLRISQD